MPNYGVMLALDQIRVLAHNTEELANEPDQLLGVIATTLKSHSLTLLCFGISSVYVIAQQGGTCSVIGSECCSDVINPTNDLNQYVKELEDLHDRLSHMDQVDVN